MRAKVLGAAVAAMVAGWAGGAQAAPLIKEVLTLDTDFGQFQLTTLPLTMFNETLSGPISGYFANGTAFVRYNQTENLLSFGIDASRLISFGEESLLRGSFEITPSTLIQIGSSFKLKDADISANQLRLRYDFNSEISFQPLITGVTFSVSAVPLPSSAPLFGAALVMLGSIGFALRRSQAAKAA